MKSRDENVRQLSAAPGPRAEAAEYRREVRKRKLQVYEQYLARRAMMRDFRAMVDFMTGDAWAAVYSARLARHGGGPLRVKRDAPSGPHVASGACSRFCAAAVRAAPGQARGPPAESKPDAPSSPLVASGAGSRRHVAAVRAAQPGTLMTAAAVARSVRSCSPRTSAECCSSLHAVSLS